MMLDIGSGNSEENEYAPPGFVYQDIEKYDNTDLVCDIRDLREHIESGQCKVIRASHVMEHFGHQEIDSIFSMIYDLLEPGGMFHITVPDLESQAEKLLNVDNQYQIMVEMFGGQKDDLDFHKMGFTPEILKNVLERNGFNSSNIIKVKIGWLDCKATKE